MKSKKILVSALEINSGFSNSIFAGRQLWVRQIEPGAGQVSCTSVLRSFVSILLLGGPGYEDLRFRSPVAFDHWLRPSFRSPRRNPAQDRGQLPALQYRAARGRSLPDLAGAGGFQP